MRIDGIRCYLNLRQKLKFSVESVDPDTVIEVTLIGNGGKFTRQDVSVERVRFHFNDTEGRRTLDERVWEAVDHLMSFEPIIRYASPDQLKDILDSLIAGEI